MTQTSLSDVKTEIRKRIKHYETLRAHPGCGISGKRSYGNRLSTLSELLGWINKNDN